MEYIKNQPILNIGMLGHVTAGKSQLVYALSGVKTQRYSEEEERNITIKLGYANAKIYKCGVCNKYGVSDFCCKTEATLCHHVSFVDCPGHEVLMTTMLNGTAVMDGAVVVIAANETIPQPQTVEHLNAARIMGLKTIGCINKMDLIYKQNRLGCAVYDKTKELLGDNSPIIPIVAVRSINIDALCRHICEMFPPKQVDLNEDPFMICIRSFDINKPGANMLELKGGVAGGSIIHGTLRIGDEIEIRPGLYKVTETGIKCRYLKTKVNTMFSNTTPLEIAVPGGLIAIGTDLDPALTIEDRLVGQILGINLPMVYDYLRVKYELIERLDAKIAPIKKKEQLKINVNSSEILCGVTKVNNENDIVLQLLDKPVCAHIDSTISISRKYDGKWRLIAVGKLLEGRECESY